MATRADGTAALGRTTDAERDESLAANRGGFSFLFVHGLTWIVAAALTFVLPLKDAALVYLFQGFVAFPASLVLERLLGFRTLSTRENSLVSLFVLIAVAQGLALPASIVAFSLDPRYLPIVFAATNGGHFLPYSWLHRTRAYVLLAVVAALGPYVLVVVAGPDATFHLSGFLVGGALLVTAAYVLVISSRRAAAMASAADSTSPITKE
jgi:hypothetical protein